MRFPLRQTQAVKFIAALVLCSVAFPAAAEYASYRGQVRLQSKSSDVCAALASDATLAIEVFGRDDAPGQRIDAYIYGEKIVPVHVTGYNVNNLSVTFPGESSPRHTMQLRTAGNGSFSGEMPVRTLMSALSGCNDVTAAVQFSNVGMHTQGAYEQAAALFQMDVRALQAYGEGIQGRVREGLPVLQNGLQAKEKIYGNGNAQLLPYYFLLARLHQADGSFPDEVPLYRAALSVCEHAYGADSACVGFALTGLSNALLEAGNYAEAESAVRHALAICDKVFGPGAAVSGGTLNALGAILIYTGRFAEAESTLNHALLLNKKLNGGENANVGVSLTNLGVLFRFTGEYSKAESVMRQALAVDVKTLGKDSPLTLLNTIYLGQILRLSGRFGEAEPLCRGALASAEKLLGPERPDHPALDAGLMCLAELLRETRRYTEAEPLYRKALANDLKFLGPDNPEVAVTSLNLAKLLHATGRDPEAMDLLKRAYRIAHVSDSQLISWRVPGELMGVYAAKSANSAIGIFYGKEAVNKLQQLRGNLTGSNEAARQAFVGAAEVSSVYRTLADLLIADHRLTEAQQILAMLKEQEFYDFTKDSSKTADPRKTVATFSQPEKELDDLNGKDVALGKELGVLQEKMRRNPPLTASERDRLTTLRKLTDAAQASFDARITAVAKSSNDPEAQKLRRQQITDLSRSFQGTLKDLGHDAVMLQYFILDDKVQILLTTPNAEVAREAPIAREELNRQIRSYRQTLGNPTQDPLPQAKALYQLLMGPVAQDLRQAGAKTLMLSLDDTLRYLPFAALHDGNGYLIEKYAVVMVNEAVRDKLAKPPNPTWSVWGLGVTQAHEGSEALPWVGAELNGITGPKGILAGKVLLDKQFNEESLRDGLDQAYPIIHIASHFRFEPGSMDDSVLLLGDGSLMTLAQIKNKLNFNGVELLTLSACETGVGDDGAAHHGIEVEGLGAIAQQAGAKAVLASLWSVADSSTALLMRTLYLAHKDDHLTKAESLRFAQLALLHGSVQSDPSTKGQRGLARVSTSQASGNFQPDPTAPFGHPFYWAPFILMGNWL
jgi:CHAT domain-containing protein/tetratricopeptide (TPR) repeat protein